MLHKKLSRLAMALGGMLLLAAPLAACSSDDDEASTSLSVEATEFEFSDTSWTVPAGEEISITFQNNGAVQHEWAVINLGMDLSSGDDFTEEHVLWEIEKQDPGVRVTENFTFDTPGVYQIVCALEGHVDAGMIASLTVS